MKTHRLMRRVCCLLVALVLLGVSSGPALAADRGIDMDREGSIVLSLFYDGKPVSGGNLRLYKAGEAIRNSCYDIFLPLIFVALIYLGIVTLLTWLVGKLERSLRKNER